MLMGVNKRSPSFSEVGLYGHAGPAWPPPHIEQTWRKLHWDMVHRVLLKLLQIERPPWCMMGLPFLSMPLVAGKMTEGADDTCFGGMGAGGTAVDRREKAEALVRF